MYFNDKDHNQSVELHAVIEHYPHLNKVNTKCNIQGEAFVILSSSLIVNYSNPPTTTTKKKNLETCAQCHVEVNPPLFIKPGF